MNICVFCSSSDAVDKKYFAAAHRLGVEIVKNKHSLVYGGANKGAHAGNRRVSAASRRQGNKRYP